MDKENLWMLSKEGWQLTCEYKDGAMDDFVKSCQHLRGDALVAETYRLYPYYAIRNSVAKHILKQDKTTLRRIKDAIPEKKPARLLTIGYEGRTLENYLNASDSVECNSPLRCSKERFKP